MSDDDLLTIHQHHMSLYGPRTFANVQRSDLSLAFAVDFGTAGEKLTTTAAANLRKPFVGCDLKRPHRENVTLINKALSRITQPTLAINVAGNGIYTLKKHGWSQEQVNRAVYLTLLQVHQGHRITSVRSGGQTGADIAGAVAGVLLEVDTLLYMPKSCRQRNEENMDEYHTADEIREQVMQGTYALRHLMEV